MSAFDYIIHPRWIVPIAPKNIVLENHSLAVKDGHISAICPQSEGRFLSAGEHIDLPTQALLPGFINAHGHAAMALLRGYADDYPLMTWLQEHIWPAETEFVSEEFVKSGTDLALLELIRGGTTTFSDMYFFPDVTAERADFAGIRAQLMFPIIDVPTAWAADPESYLAKGLALRDRYRGHDRVEIGFGPHANYTVSESTLARVATLANELDAPIQIHLHETRGEVQMSVENIGERPIDQLARIGLLGPRTQCVHMTALANEDMALLATSGAHVIHCPRSNMKLASGICPTQRLLNSGVNVAIGTDGAASNNRLNMLAELQSAALLAKLESGEATAISAATALEMATLNGAKALGLDAITGSLEIGKVADMIAISLDEPSHQPINNVLSQLVYATAGTEVTHSWVSGAPLMTDGQVISLNSETIYAEASQWRQRLHSFNPNPATPEEHAAQ